MNGAIRYVGGQVAAYFVDYGTFALLVWSGLLPPVVCNAVGKIAAGAFAFLFHRFVTFQAGSSGPIGGQLVRYAAVLGVNTLASSALLEGLLRMHLQPLLAKAVSDAMLIVVTFFVSKHFVFRVGRLGS